MNKMVMSIGLMLLLYTFGAESFNTTFMESGTSSKLAKDISDILRSGRLSISISCTQHLLKYVTDLLSEEMWALKMFDSNSKFPSGFLNGHLVDLGSFDECLNVNGTFNATESVFGKYCLATIPLKLRNIYSAEDLLENLKNISYPLPQGQTGIQLATCMPHTCSATEIGNLYSAMDMNMNFYEEFCQTKDTQRQWDGIAFITTGFFGIIMAIMLISTVYDSILSYDHRASSMTILSAFSILKNARSIITPTRSTSQISCLHGIRVLTLAWLMYGHFYRVKFSIPSNNNFYTTHWYNYEENIIIMTIGTGVDTFFVIGGLLVSYNYLTGMKRGTKFNILKYYLHRYIRLTPVLIAIIVLTIGLLSHTGSGPLWPQRIDERCVNHCKKNWWRALLYIQNYGVTDNSLCVDPSWYLSIDFQLYILSPIILIPLCKWPSATLLFTGFLTVLSVTWAFYVSWIFELPINMSLIVESATQKMQYMNYYYFSMYIRAAPWLIGFILGYMVFTFSERKTKFAINKVTVIILWLLSIGTLYICAFGGHDLVRQYNKVPSVLYMTFVKPAWSVAVSWTIFACVSGYGGPINRFLAMPSFEILSKLTYVLYITHWGVMQMVQSRVTETSIQGNFLSGSSFWGEMALSLVLGVLLTLSIELPMVTIEKCTLHRRKVFDASAKIPAGILGGNLVDFGNFNQCLETQGNTSSGLVNGKYCLGALVIPLSVSAERLRVLAHKVESRFSGPIGKESLMLGQCLPSACSAPDIQELYNKIIKVPMNFYEVFCQSQDTQQYLEVPNILAIIFFSTVAVIIGVSTVYDVITKRLQKEPVHPITTVFSIFRNFKTLFEHNRRSGQITCIYGICSITMMWIVLQYRDAYILQNPVENLVNMIPQLQENAIYMGLTRSTIAIDTFLVLNGLVVSYSYVQKRSRGIKVNFFWEYLHRYLRLTPTYAVLALFHANLMEHTGTGPLWYYRVTPMAENCRLYWWSGILYLQNYLNPLDVCITQSWYLSVDMQMFLISPLILISLERWPKYTLYVTGFISFLMLVVGGFLVVWLNEINALGINNVGRKKDIFVKNYYHPTHIRGGTWLIGVILGYFIFTQQSKKPAKLSKPVVFCLWIISLVVMCSCVFAGFDLAIGQYIRLEHAFFAAFVRPSWSIAISWIIFACMTGYGGPINWFLSLPGFEVLSRLVYGIYLSHSYVQATTIYQMRRGTTFSNLSLLHLFWGDFMFSAGIALLIALAFDLPIAIMERYLVELYERKSKRKPLQEKKHLSELT